MSEQIGQVLVESFDERAPATVRLAFLRQTIAEATDVLTVARLVDYSEAAKVAARRAGVAEQEQREWAVVSLEAQRKAGELLARMPKAKNQHVASVTLKEALGGTTVDANNKAKRWQDVAAVPEPVFREYVATADEITRARLLRIGRDHAAATAREQAPAPLTDPDVDLRVGDFRQVLSDLRDVDAIITDPPYPSHFLPLLSDLAAFADQALADDGVLAVLIGQTHLPAVYQLLSAGRPYRWTAAYMTPGASYTSMPRRLTSNWKPVLIYGGGPRFNDVIPADRDDKRHHVWGQDYGGFSTLVERLSPPAGLVVDPFLGGGTTAVAARNLGRRFVGSDIDAECVAVSQQRLARSA